jgi:hypothetical protein
MPHFSLLFLSSCIGNKERKLTKGNRKKKLSKPTKPCGNKDRDSRKPERDEALPSRSALSAPWPFLLLLLLLLLLNE